MWSGLTYFLFICLYRLTKTFLVNSKFRRRSKCAIFAQKGSKIARMIFLFIFIYLFYSFFWGAILSNFRPKNTNSKTTLHSNFLSLNLFFINQFGHGPLLRVKKSAIKIHLLWHLLSIFWERSLVSFATLHLQRHFLYTMFSLSEKLSDDRR